MTATSSIELYVGPFEFVRIESVQRFSDGSGYVGNLSLRSGDFALYSHRFYFEDLDGFVAQTRRLYDTVSGSAHLRHPYERNHVLITASSRGHVTVTGHFESFDGASQRLEFGFSTDQTYLPAFIRSLDQVCRELETKA